MDIASLSQILISGLLVGCIYGMGALGFTIVFNATRVINFANGDFLMLGGIGSAALMDANAAGKFTLNHASSGLVRTTSTCVRFVGKDVAYGSAAGIAHAGFRQVHKCRRVFADLLRANARVKEALRGTATAHAM